jgi:hypothetical protein
MSLLPKPISFNSTRNNDFLMNRRRESSLFLSAPNSELGQKQQRHKSKLVIQAKGKKGMQNRQFQPPRAPPLPKFEEDGNPRFVVFIRMATVNLWYPLSVISGGTTAKIMVAAKDNFLGKYIYKDTLARNLAAVIYKDEKEIQKTAQKQHSMLRNAKEFKYGYKLVENNNMRAALSTSDVIELPSQDQLKTVVDKVKDFLGNAKESFGNLTSLDTPTPPTTPALPDKTTGEKSK